ncbi:MAG: LPXTG cell wall anchor domain-containing protein [Bacilli bacterium]|jgi:LPXTG-motif cell wall-anchored protein|nr:LPXTG cell wall anchor domain-containing protein [Bacilli bacterium]
MKKKIFGFVLALVFVMLPTIVRAADFGGSIFLSQDANMTVTTLNPGVTVTCPKDASGDNATCYIGLRVTSGTAKNLSVKATLTNLKYDSIEEMNGWTYTSSPTISGNTVTFNLANRTGTTAGNTILVAKVSFKVNNKAQNCNLTLTPLDNPTTTPESCRVEGGKYYCENGVECSKEDYEKKCIPENPTTGSAVPYLVVLGGLGIAGVFYFVTRKKAKIYHV